MCAARERVNTWIRQQRFYRLKISLCPEDPRFHPEGVRICGFQREDAVRDGKSFRKTAHHHASSRENEGGIDVARIELDGVPQACNRLVPMSKPSLDQGDRLDDINVIRQTLLGSLEFRQCPAEIALPVKAVITKS